MIGVENLAEDDGDGATVTALPLELGRVALWNGAGRRLYPAVPGASGCERGSEETGIEENDCGVHVE